MEGRHLIRVSLRPALVAAGLALTPSACSSGSTPQEQATGGDSGTGAGSLASAGGNGGVVGDRPGTSGSGSAAANGGQVNAGGDARKQTSGGKPNNGGGGGSKSSGGDGGKANVAGAAGLGGGGTGAGGAGSGGTSGGAGIGGGGGPGTGGATSATFSTNFGLTEASISEGQAWQTGQDPFQTPVATGGGIAFGTQSGLEIADKNYNDSEAWLAGSFSPNQSASAVIHKAPGLSGGYLEVEILLRWSVGALRTGLKYGETHSYGYEINLAWDGQYSGIARFKEEAICWSGNIAALGVQDGDIFSAEIVGNTITSKLTRNGVSNVLCTVTDNAPFPSGTPGIGFYRGTNAGAVTTPTSFAFTSFSATSL